MPVASPAWVWGVARGHLVGHGRERDAHADAEHGAGDVDLPRLVMRGGEQREGRCSEQASELWERAGGVIDDGV